MLLRLLPLLLALASGSCAATVQPSAQAEATTAFVGVTVAPMTDATTMLRDQTVLVRGEQIVAVGPRARVHVPAGARRIDGAGRYLTPGLADMHVHLEHLEDPDILKLFIASGVTTVRSMDGRPFMLDWRRRVAAGELVGPRIVTAGPIIDGSPPARDDNLAVADAAAARAAVQAQKAAGYDFIKVYVNLSPDAYRAVLDEARTQGLRVAGHKPRGVELAEVVAGQWSIEHLSDFAAPTAQAGVQSPGWTRAFLAAPLDGAKAAALAEHLARAKVWVVPTTVERDRALAPPATVETWVADPVMRDLPAHAAGMWKAALSRVNGRLDADDWAVVERGRENRLRLVRAFHDAGVALVVGTDTPNAFVVPGAAMHLELANFVRAGLSPGQALMAATAAPARMLGPLGDAGVVAVGKRADLLLLARDPLVDVSALQAPLGVMASGRWYDQARLRDMRDDLAGP